MSELDTLIRLLAKLPGLGPRSARRAALHLVRRRESLLEPLAAALAKTAETVRPCPICSNLDTIQPCGICRDPQRDETAICVVGTLSALDGIGPDDLNIERLVGRLKPGQELILALNATVEGQTTAHYLADRVAGRGVTVSRLAQGVPIGGELDYLDDGTLTAALKARRSL